MRFSTRSRTAKTFLTQETGSKRSETSCFAEEPRFAREHTEGRPVIDPKLSHSPQGFRAPRSSITTGHYRPRPPQCQCSAYANWSIIPRDLYLLPKPVANTVRYQPSTPSSPLLAAIPSAHTGVALRAGAPLGVHHLATVSLRCVRRKFNSDRYRFWESLLNLAKLLCNGLKRTPSSTNLLLLICFTSYSQQPRHLPGTWIIHVCTDFVERTH